MKKVDKFQRLALLLCVAAIVLALALLLDGGADDEPDLAPYHGLGTWLDNFDWSTWKDPGTPQRADQTTAAMRRRGATTLFLATSHHSQPDDVVNPRAVSATIEAAHRQGMKVVAWYQPSLENPARDLRRALAAIRFETEDGEHVDSFALDIESRTVTPVERRNARLLRLAAQLRDEVGSSYALGAIVPSPRLFELYPNSWRGFPFRGLARYFDVFLPMAYWTYHASTFNGARDYVRDSISGIRRLTRDPDMPVHAIGGTARHATSAGMRGFLRATSSCGTVGLSLYDFLTTSRASWLAIADRPEGAPQPRPSCAWSLREPVALATARAARLEAQRQDRLERRVRAKHAKQQKRRHERKRGKLSVREQQQRDHD